MKDLGFTIAVDTEKCEEELLAFIYAAIPGAVRERGECGYVRVMSNLLRFESNFDHDPSKTNQQENGWEYYKFDLHAFTYEETTFENQKTLASILLRELSSMGAKVLLLAEFEVQ